MLRTRTPTPYLQRIHLLALIVDVNVKIHIGAALCIAFLILSCMRTRSVVASHKQLG